MAIEKKSLKKKKQGPVVGDPEASAAKGSGPEKLGVARKLEIAKLVNTKLSTAKLATIRRLGG